MKEIKVGLIRFWHRGFRCCKNLAEKLQADRKANGRQARLKNDCRRRFANRPWSELKPSILTPEPKSDRGS